jgi:hypothetical protein
MTSSNPNYFPWPHPCSGDYVSGRDEHPGRVWDMPKGCLVLQMWGFWEASPPEVWRTGSMAFCSCLLFLCSLWATDYYTLNKHECLHLDILSLFVATSVKWFKCSWNIHLKKKRNGLFLMGQEFSGVNILLLPQVQLSTRQVQGESQ